MDRKGFTLLELLIVFIIISTTVSIALPQYICAIEKARSAEAMITIGSLRSSIYRYWYDQKSLSDTYHPATFDNLDIDNPNNIKS